MSSKRTIAIIAGGDSSEIVISLKTAEVVFSHLDKTLYDCYMLKVIGKEWTAEIQKTKRIQKEPSKLKVKPIVLIKMTSASLHRMFEYNLIVPLSPFMEPLEKMENYKVILIC